MSAEQMRWWGWAEPEAPIEVSAAGEELLRSELGLGRDRFDPVPLDEVRLPEPAPLALH